MTWNFIYTGTPIALKKKVNEQNYGSGLARRMMDAADNESKADEMLLKRCAYHGLNFAAPFIVMRHWDKMKQEGTYWCGEVQSQ